VAEGALGRFLDAAKAGKVPAGSFLLVESLDRLMIVIEDRFADVVITDEDIDQLEVVGDLIRHIENVDNERRRRPIVEAPLQ